MSYTKKTEENNEYEECTSCKTYVIVSDLVTSAETKYKPTCNQCLKAQRAFLEEQAILNHPDYDESINYEDH